MILTIEGSLADILSVLTVTALLTTPAGKMPVAMLVRTFSMSIAISLALGIAAGVGWAFLLPRLSDRRFWQVLTFGAVLVLFAVTQVAGGGDLLAVLVFGLVLANLPLARRYLSAGLGMLEGQEKSGDEPAQLLAFHAELSFLVRTFFFVLVGMDIRFEGFLSEWLPIMVIFAAILLARGLSITTSRLLWRESHPMERELAFWMHPRGLITVVLALRVVNVKGPSWAFLVDLAFAMLLLSGVGMTIGTVRGKRLESLQELQDGAVHEPIGG